ncbi:MAG: DUF423 domain-containing protein [Alphaproteobacteria bacterium]
MTRMWVGLGALSALAAVIAGALGGHQGALPDADARRIFETANDYHIAHALGLILIGALTEKLPGRLIGIAAACLLAGSILFCGSLYATAFLGQHPLAVTAPIGGLLLMLGWLTLALAAFLRGKT